MSRALYSQRQFKLYITANLQTILGLTLKVIKNNVDKVKKMWKSVELSNVNNFFEVKKVANYLNNVIKGNDSHV